MAKMSSQKKMASRMRRKARVRKKVFGTLDRPRLNVFRSAKHIYVQVINDDDGTTLVAASTVDKVLRGGAEGNKTDLAKSVGLTVAQRCKERGIAAVVFDRNGYRYHGRIQAVAEAAREGGLNF